ncbi:hypothetical protein ACFL3V_03395 [Nanoarchaeota archaeon]
MVDTIKKLDKDIIERVLKIQELLHDLLDKCVYEIGRNERFMHADKEAVENIRMTANGLYEEMHTELKKVYKDALEEEHLTDELRIKIEEQVGLLVQQ